MLYHTDFSRRAGTGTLAGALLASLTLLAAPGRGHAQTPVRIGTVNGFHGFSLASQGQGYANQFTVGPADVTVTGATAFLASEGDASTTTFVAFIINDNNNQAGSQLVGAVGSQTVPSAFTNATFTPASPFVLSANTKYWFMIGVSSVVNGDWGYGDPATDNSTAGMVSDLYSKYDGTNWLTPNSRNSGNDFYLFQINGTTQQGGGAVPEPGEWAFYGIMGAGLVGLFIRKRMNDVVRARRRMA